MLAPEQPLPVRKESQALPANIIDHSRIFSRWNSLGPIVLDLGCGPNKKSRNWIGIDKSNYPGVDIQGDIFAVLQEFEDQSVDHIYTSHFCERIEDVGLLVKEMTRILKVGGKIHVIVPHFSNPYFFSDYTHKTFFGLYSFSYFAQDGLYQRKVPQYHDFSQKLSLLDVQLIFKSTRPFYLSYAIKKMFGYLLNSSRYMQELYEENLSSFIGCYEIHFFLENTAKD